MSPEDKIRFAVSTWGWVSGASIFVTLFSTIWLVGDDDDRPVGAWILGWWSLVAIGWVSIGIAAVATVLHG